MSTMRSSPRLAQRRHAQRDLARDVAERVAAFVAVHTRIVEGADADAVEHDDDDSGKKCGHGYAMRAGPLPPSACPDSRPTSEATLG